MRPAAKAATFAAPSLYDFGHARAALDSRVARRRIRTGVGLRAGEAILEQGECDAS
jgi:hypothetical protein